MKRPDSLQTKKLKGRDRHTEVRAIAKAAISTPIFRTHTAQCTHLRPFFTLGGFSLHICDWSLFSLYGRSIHRVLRRMDMLDLISAAKPRALTTSRSTSRGAGAQDGAAVRCHDVTIDESRGRGARTCGASPLRPGPPRRRVGARGAKLNRSAPKTARWRARREVQSIGAAAAARSCSRSAVSSAEPTSSSSAPISARLVCTSARSSSR